ncbi:class I SAM-dependent methyltransferase [Humibacter sp.]|uniref:class I SAM-dependent methyltransferase n=1 Tax=Humibacter sp. TaxID=1940291 RepID=UPI003F80A4E6
MVDPMHFDGVAQAYAATRPPYPDALWRDVRATGLVAAGRRGLDLGAGTGEATGELLARGMDVVAVEPGTRLADVLEARFPRATVIRSRAEDIQLDAASFDLVVAATSIHWMDLDVVLPIVRHGLRPDGRLLVWRNVFGDAEADATPFRREVTRIVSRRGTTRPGNPDDVEATAEKLARSRFFAVDGIHRYRWTIDLTTEQIRGLFSTFSDWTPDEVRSAADAVAALGGSVTEHYTSWLIVASPVG